MQFRGNLWEKCVWLVGESWSKNGNTGSSEPATRRSGCVLQWLAADVLGVGDFRNEILADISADFDTFSMIRRPGGGG